MPHMDRLNSVVPMNHRRVLSSRRPDSMIQVPSGMVRCTASTMEMARFSAG